MIHTDEAPFQLAHPPIVEALIDIECDLPPGFDLATVENQARDLFRPQYPKLRMQFMQELQIEQKGDEPPKHSTRRGLQAFQFLHDDEKQLVQLRTQGFTFNRLAPYSSLDDYLPEIERAWRLFVEVVSPVQIRLVRLRYINRILLPISGSRVEMNDYFKIGPRLPDEDSMTLVGFLNQHTARETETGNLVNIILTAQPQDGEHFPVIFDIDAVAVGPVEATEWAWVQSKIASLRSLKNRVFRNTLTEQCLNLFHE